MDLLAGVEHWAATAPERLAQQTADRSISYRNLWAGANGLAAQIGHLGLMPGAPIVIRGHKEPEALVGFLGCLLAGHPYVPVDSGLPTSRASEIAELARAAIVLEIGDIVRLAAEGGAPPDRPRPLEEVQYIMFTSGSSGRPKGVPITRGNLAQFHRWLVDEHGFVPTARRVLDQAIYSFDLSVMSVYPTLVSGGSLVALSTAEIANPHVLFRALANAKLDVWVSTPTFAQLCLSEPRFNHSMLPALARFWFCGEALPARTARALLDRFPGAEVWNTYGPTEATVAVTSIRVDRALLDRYEIVPIGRPGRGTRITIVDERLEPLPEGERGEILIAGPSVSPGYLDAPALTARSFLRWGGEWAYRTGDWGHVEDGLLFFDGRNDDQVKLHGYRIELGDIEANLRRLPGVHAAAVVAVPSNALADSLEAYVVLESLPMESDARSANAIKEQLAQLVPRYMVPRRIRVLNALPMTPNGKLDRRALVESSPRV